MSKTLHRTLQAKMAVLEGPEWDSSDEEGNKATAPAKQEKKSKKSPGNKDKTQSKQKQRDDNEQDHGKDDVVRDENLVLYIGHLPKEFQERDLIRFLSQFGKVQNCRVARKIETGNPKGYAFVRFQDTEVSKIVCDTLHGYFLGKQRLVCQLCPSKKGMFFNTDSVMKHRAQQRRLQRNRRLQNLNNTEKLKEITARLLSREQTKRKKLQEMGIDYDFPGYKSNQAELKVQQESAHNEKRDQENEDLSNMDSDSKINEESNKKRKSKEKRKESIDSVESATSVKRGMTNSVYIDGTAATQESADIEAPTEQKKSKKKRKESVDSESSAKNRKSKKLETSDLTVKQDEGENTLVASNVRMDSDSGCIEGSTKKKKSKKMRKESMDSVESVTSVRKNSGDIDGVAAPQESASIESPTEKQKSKNNRKDSLDSETSTKNKVLVTSDLSVEENEGENTTVANNLSLNADSGGNEGNAKKKKSKKKRKESMDSVESAASVKRARKDSVDIHGSAAPQDSADIESSTEEKKIQKKRKNSVDSETSAKNRKCKELVDSDLSVKVDEGEKTSVVRTFSESGSNEGSTKKTKSKNKRNESMDSVERVTSVNKARKNSANIGAAAPQESADIEASTKQKKFKEKRKDSVDSDTSAKNRQRNELKVSDLPVEESGESTTVANSIAQSTTKPKKKRNKKKRRQSAP